MLVKSFLTFFFIIKLDNFETYLFGKFEINFRRHNIRAAHNLLVSKFVEFNYKTHCMF